MLVICVFRVQLAGNTFGVTPTAFPIINNINYGVNDDNIGNENNSKIKDAIKRTLFITLNMVMIFFIL